MAECWACNHYKRRCQVLAPCCNEWVGCRLCHDEIHEDHRMDRHAVTQMRCLTCDTPQACAQTCINCDTSMARYFCAICNLFDDDGVQKQVFHCDDCGICRVGGRANFFHCQMCCGCYPLSLQGKHKCIEKAMAQDCPICLESLFLSRDNAVILNCGHVLHSKCLKHYGHFGDCCPMCRTPL